ncbi:3-hydroxyacyl-CoA dehydrogenase [Aliidongia dinghuensis]|uniref:3-hydroxyacyl-CoA dehydrogenase n=1 Tax=Aliidongia dinghuensis TaxID=1867774 RepID=A0A8J3E478_9PROT|nr:3-hydroxyacyl-CoA dehydrogenase/enoyl-CoA hydratase family protein [Aliidongia dinghuensis]GGF21790.1 3-hydroxyacyl-CoA dehydrogenase [Aliidongia dinghuensis]
MSIQKAAVLGAGVMGSGIAAHIANAGVPVVLLDIVPKGAENRSVIAEGAVQKLLKADPAAFMHPRNAKLVTTGNLEDHLDLLKDCDLIIEAVLEDPQVKRDLYARVEAVRKDGSIVSSNTSTIPLKILTQGLPQRFARDFLVTHFFNPPRYMRLLELVAGPETRADAVKAVEAFGDEKLGKGIVHCKDTPGFIANRIGTYWIQASINAAMDLGLTVEEADAVMGKPFGIPKTGVFGLIDLVGLDLMPHVSKSLQTTLPASDPYQAIYRTPELFKRMIADGYTGRKGKGGFYRLNREAGKRKEAIDLKTGEYRPQQKAELESASLKHPAEVLSHHDRGGAYARAAIGGTLAYAASLVPEICDTVAELDAGMKLGYNWKYGPFELIDRIGVDRVIEALEVAGQKVPALLLTAKGKSFYRVENGKLEYLTVDGAYKPVVRPDGVLLLEDIKRASKPLAKNGSAALWDIGDGVACLEFTSKMNSIDPEIMAMIQKAIGIVGKGMKGLVVYNEGSNFSVGANLGLAIFAANIAMWPTIEESVAAGQATYKALKFAPFPVVAAPKNMALGGGCEVCLHSDAIQAHAELYIGLVEVGVGVIPGWGGCKELTLRALNNKKRPGGPMSALAQVFETISTAKVSRSAEDARELGILRPADGITMNADRLLADAKAKVLALAKDYKAPEPQKLRLPGPTAEAGFNLAVADFHRQGKATKHDVVVAGALARVLAGGDTDMVDEIDEDRLTELEREAFMSLIKTPGTLARIEHMLETGKPLRN